PLAATVAVVPSRGDAASHPAFRGSPHGHRGTEPGCPGCPGGGSGSTSVGVRIGPVHGGVTIHGNDVAVSASAGPRKVHVHTKHVSKIVRSLTKKACPL